MHVVTLPVPLHSLSTTCLNILLGKIFWIFCYKSTRIPNGQFLPRLLHSLTGDLASFGPGKDFYPQWDIIGNHSHDRFQAFICQTSLLFRLIIVHMRKKLFKCVSTAKHHHHSWPKGSQERKIFFWQVEIKDLQFCFRTLLAKISYHTAN